LTIDRDFDVVDDKVVKLLDLVGELLAKDVPAVGRHRYHLCLPLIRDRLVRLKADVLRKEIVYNLEQNEDGTLPKLVPNVSLSSYRSLGPRRSVVRRVEVDGIDDLVSLKEPNADRHREEEGKNDERNRVATHERAILVEEDAERFLDKVEVEHSGEED